MNNSFDWRDMLRFDKMIAPTFLTILYYILIAAVVLAGLKLVFEGMDAPYYGSKMVMGGLALLTIGPFIVRLYIELLIVIFKIHTRLSNIDYTLRGQPTGALTNESPNPTPPQTNLFGTAPLTYPLNYPAAEQPGFARPIQTPVPDPVSQPPIGFQVPTTEPLVAPIAAGQSMPDFWATNESLPPTTPVPPVELGNTLKKVPNWPAALAALIVLYAVLSPYAVIGFGAPSSLGQMLGLTYSIKNSSLGIVVVLSTLVMLGTSAGGLKWLWFVVGYGVTALGSLLAFLEESSVFSQLSKAKATMGAVSSTLGDFMPQADQISRQMVQNVPSPSQFLNVTFYLFIMAMLFLGYWALAGKYQERGFMTTTTA